jgi:antitoxin component YwqK of YwqJK toxin-antitoxin module
MMSLAPSFQPSFLSPAPDAAPGQVHVVEEFDVKKRTPLVAGVAHGTVQHYGDAGLLSMEARFLHGQLDGLLRCFDEHGVLLQEAHYHEGKLAGVKATYEDGRIASRQAYVAGVLHGISVTYAPSGLMTSHIVYEAGLREREGLYVLEGVVVRRMRFYRNKLQGETRDYTADGALVQSSMYQADLLHGKMRRYSADGVMVRERDYVHGKPQGIWRDVSKTPGLDASSVPDGISPAQPDGPRLVRSIEKWVTGKGQG